MNDWRLTLIQFNWLYMYCSYKMVLIISRVCETSRQVCPLECSIVDNPIFDRSFLMKNNNIESILPERFFYDIKHVYAMLVKILIYSKPIHRGCWDNWFLIGHWGISYIYIWDVFFVCMMQHTQTSCNWRWLIFNKILQRWHIFSFII